MNYNPTPFYKVLKHSLGTVLLLALFLPTTTLAQDDEQTETENLLEEVIVQ